MKYMSRPKNAAVKDISINIDIADILGKKYRIDRPTSSCDIPRCLLLDRVRTSPWFLSNFSRPGKSLKTNKVIENTWIWPRYWADCVHGGPGEMLNCQGTVNVMFCRVCFAYLFLFAKHELASFDSATLFHEIVTGRWSILVYRSTFLYYFDSPLKS